MDDIKKIIQEICDLKIIPKTIIEITDARGRKYIEETEAKVESINMEKFNLLPEIYKEYLLKYFMFYKDIQIPNRGYCGRAELIQMLFPENSLTNIFKQYPNILLALIEYSIKINTNINANMLGFILLNKKDIYINKKMYLYFEKLALEYKSKDILFLLNKYHIDDELFNSNSVLNNSEKNYNENDDNSSLYQEDKNIFEIETLRKLIKDKDSELMTKNCELIAEKEKYSAFEEKIKSLLIK